MTPEGCSIGVSDEYGAPWARIGAVRPVATVSMYKWRTTYATTEMTPAELRAMAHVLVETADRIDAEWPIPTTEGTS